MDIEIEKSEFQKVLEEFYNLYETMPNLAKALSVPQRTLEDWKAGKRTPPPYVQNLFKLLLENLKS